MSNLVKPLLGDVTFSQHLVRHRTLGTFRRTGRVDVPKPGEYFLQPAEVGFVVHGVEMRHAYEILEPVKE